MTITRNSIVKYKCGAKRFFNFQIVYNLLTQLNGTIPRYIRLFVYTITAVSNKSDCQEHGVSYTSLFPRICAHPTR